MITMWTMADVKVWTQNVGGLTGTEEGGLAEAIRNDRQHPAWGRDWSDYLGRIDIARTVTAGEVVFFAD